MTVYDPGRTGTSWRTPSDLINDGTAGFSVRGQSPMLDEHGSQTQLLRSLFVHHGPALACGLVEPAQETAGDAFDFAANGCYLDAAVFDGMGHGRQAAALASLAVAAYRHARDKGGPLDELFLAVDEAVQAEYAGQKFVTGVLARLELDNGALEWASAGHPAPLLMRKGQVIEELGCAPLLPFGLGDGRFVHVVTKQLEPGDALLLFTDGVTESRSLAGDLFGTEGIARLWEQEWPVRRPVQKTLREMAKALVDFNAGKLHDDAMLLVVHWGTADEHTGGGRLPRGRSA
jgi:serine phosphatase RsbU (regulator of sigma subunit)